MDAELQTRQDDPVTDIPASRTQGQAVLATVGMAVLGPVAGSLLANLLLPETVWADALGFFALPLVFGFGYKVWMARLATVAWNHLLSGFVRVLWHALVHRKAPAVSDVLPTREKLQAMLRDALNATSVFARMGVWFGVLNGVAAAWIARSGLALLSGAVFLGASVLYGAALTRLGRNGLLAFPESG
jgi:hypothetical protein